MNNDESTAIERNTIHLTAFAAKKTDNGVLLNNIGKFPLSLQSDPQSHTKGTIMIDGKKLPIMSNSRMSRLPHENIDNNSCILLVDGNLSSGTFKFGILINDVSEIQQIAYNELF